MDMENSVHSEIIKAINHLSKSQFICQGDVQSIAREILKKSAELLGIQRTNAWLLNDEEDYLTSLLAYKYPIDSFYQENDLQCSDLPRYMSRLQEMDIIISVRAQEELFNREILDAYLIPNNIVSMMEIPIFTNGKLKGVVCFESVGMYRNWQEYEQHFALTITHLLTLTLEAREKGKIKANLEKLLREKFLLIAEINHRVKNNLAVITALIRMESDKAKDKYHQDLFYDILTKIYSLSALQNLMSGSDNYHTTNSGELITKIVSIIDEMYGVNYDVKINLELRDIPIAINTSIPLSLIINEVLVNAYKYAFREDRTNILTIHFHPVNSTHAELLISDNGSGLPHDYNEKGAGLGLVQDLSYQINGSLEVNTSAKGTSIRILLTT